VCPHDLLPIGPALPLRRRPGLGVEERVCVGTWGVSTYCSHGHGEGRSRCFRSSPSRGLHLLGAARDPPAFPRHRGLDADRSPGPLRRDGAGVRPCPRAMTHSPSDARHSPAVGSRSPSGGNCSPAGGSHSPGAMRHNGAPCVAPPAWGVSQVAPCVTPPAWAVAQLGWGARPPAWGVSQQASFVTHSAWAVWPLGWGVVPQPRGVRLAGWGGAPAARAVPQFARAEP
jgi:hypothetical protein